MDRFDGSKKHSSRDQGCTRPDGDKSKRQPRKTGQSRNKAPGAGKPDCESWSFPWQLLDFAAWSCGQQALTRMALETGSGMAAQLEQNRLGVTDGSSQVDDNETSHGGGLLWWDFQSFPFGNRSTLIDGAGGEPDETA